MNGDSFIAVYFSDSSRNIDLARFSLISECRGTGCDFFVAGFVYQSCLAPWRLSRQPIVSRRLISSRLFIRLQPVLHPVSQKEPRSIPDPPINFGGSRSVHLLSTPAFRNLETRSDARGRIRHPANKCIQTSSSPFDYSEYLLNTRHAFVPPNPKLFDRTYSMFASRAAFGT